MLFNGVDIKKDWVRAYALTTRAAQAGVPQATQSLQQMDGYLSATDKQQGIALAQRMDTGSSGAPVPGLPGAGSGPAAPHTAQKAAEAARTNQRGGGGGPGRSQIGRGDVRNFSGYAQQAQNQVGIDDLRRLKGGANRTSNSNVTLGPMSMLNSRSNSGRRLGPGSALSRGAEDSGASSRTGTPPVRETQSSINSFR